jgi:cytochrome P450
LETLLRIVTKDIKLREQKIQSGDRIIAWIGSANHDESVFTDPEQFNIKRSNSISHVGFGHGIHFCLGAPLARLEGLVVLRVILQRLQDLMLDPDYIKNDMQGLSPIQSVFFHGVDHLPTFSSSL